jgi:hypothetical protein
MKEYAEILNEMKNLNLLKDVEAGHAKADDLLCDLLIQLGYAEIVEEFNNLELYYA